MPKRLKKKNPDENQAAFAVIEQLTESETPPSFEAQFKAHMAKLGQKGGKASGAKRMTNLTPEERSAIALKAAESRWKNERARKRKR